MISAASITSRIEAEMMSVMGVVDSISFKKFSIPMGLALYQALMMIQAIAPAPVPPSVVTAGGDCTIFLVMGLAPLKAILLPAMSLTVNPSDPPALSDFVDGIAPSIVYSYTYDTFTVTCPPGGGLGVIETDEAGIKDSIMSEMQSLKDIQDVSSLEDFATSFASALFKIITTDLTITFAPVGGLGVVA